MKVRLRQQHQNIKKQNPTKFEETVNCLNFITCAHLHHFKLHFQKCFISRRFMLRSTRRGYAQINQTQRRLWPITAGHTRAQLIKTRGSGTIHLLPDTKEGHSKSQQDTANHHVTARCSRLSPITGHDNLSNKHLCYWEI